MSTGLKQQWGLKDAKGPPSTAQADQFKAAYQANASVINQALQYTAVNAEKAKHAAFAAKRDKLACAYQAVLAKINPSNPSVAKSSIEATLGTAKALADKATEFKNEVEKALQAWQAVEPSFETAVNQVEELEAWPDKRAGTLRSVVAKIQEQVNKKMFVEAVKTQESFKSKLQPIYDEYLKQKEAKEKYEAALAGLQTKLTDASECRYKTLEPKQQEIEAAKTTMETAATNKDYVQALQLLGDLEAKLDAYQTAVKELDEKKQQYEDALAKLQPRLSAITASEGGKAGTIQEEMNTAQGEMEKAAQAEDYENALRLVGDLETKLTEFETLLQKRDEYKQKLEALQPRLTEASQSTGKLADLEPIQTEMARIQTDMESAATAEDYEQALQLLGELEAKVEEFFAAIEKKKKEYEAARDAALSKYNDCMVSARDFSDLKAQRDALDAKKKDMETKATAEDYDEAKKAATELDTLAADYLKQAAEKQKKYDEKGAEITKALDDANYFTRDGVAREWANKLTPDEIKYLPTAVRNRLLEEMQSGYTSDDDKESMKKLLSVEYLDPEFEKLDKQARTKMIEKMKTDPEFKKARDNWSTMTEAERIAIMQKAVDYQAEASGIPKTTIATYSKDDPKDYGFYRHSDGKLYVNSHDSALKNGGFDEAIDTAVHENGHRQQAVMIDKLEKGEIKPGDPLYNQAMTFKLNDTQRGYYVYPPRSSHAAVDKGPEYFTQPQEHHSRVTGEEVKSAGIGK